MAVLAFFTSNVALVVVNLVPFLEVSFLERIAARNPTGFPPANPFLVIGRKRDPETTMLLM